MNREVRALLWMQAITYAFVFGIAEIPGFREHWRWTAPASIVVLSVVFFCLAQPARRESR